AAQARRGTRKIDEYVRGSADGGGGRIGKKETQPKLPNLPNVSERGFSMSDSKSYSVRDHFVDKDASLRKVYDRLLAVLRQFGPVKEEAKKTSIHLVSVSALAGVGVRKNYLLLNIKADHKIESPRIERNEQISAKR